MMNRPIAGNLSSSETKDLWEHDNASLVHISGKTNYGQVKSSPFGATPQRTTLASQIRVRRPDRCTNCLNPRAVRWTCTLFEPRVIEARLGNWSAFDTNSYRCRYVSVSMATQGTP